MASLQRNTPPAPTAPSRDLLERLEAVRQKEAETLRGETAQILLEQADNDAELREYLSGLCNYGCSGGFVRQLVYYADTHAFYDRHYREIEDLRYEYEESCGSPIVIRGDLKNFFAWYAFEETAFRLGREFGHEF